ncbi:MAG: hypothetical protein U0570_04805 [Phycisphaerales bacterium]
MSVGDNANSNQPSISEIEQTLRAIESVGDVTPAFEAMRRDREQLRLALKADMASPLSSPIRQKLEQAVRDEIDLRLIARLSDGRPLPTPAPVWSLNVRNTRRLPWGRFAAIAATVAVIGSVAWLAMQRPASVRKSPVAMGAPRELPSWAVLPPQVDAPSANAGIARVEPQESLKPASEPLQTADVKLAMAWARKGMLVVRVTTDSPGRDQERIGSLAQSDRRTSAWSISSQLPAGLASIPSKPWPIDATLAGGDSLGVASRQHPPTATVGAFELALRPTAESLESLRQYIQENLAGSVTFERVDALGELGQQRETASDPTSAADVTWWKKPVGQWSPRVRVPLVLEFGEPAKTK